jgi:hypothetical protein
MLEKQVEKFTTSPFFIGILILLTNIGSRYITHEFSSSDEEYSQNILLRRIAIFAVCYMGTRDLIVSILLTAGFVILASGFLRGTGMAREGMENPDKKLRSSAGLPDSIDSPAYDKEEKSLFK